MGDFEFLGQLFGILAAILVVVLVYLVILIIACWKLFKKAGKNGWEAIVPFYNTWILAEIGGLNWWWFLLMLTTIAVSSQTDTPIIVVNLVSGFATFNCFYNIALKFGKAKGEAVCAGLFSFIYVFIFAFSKNEVYNSNIPVSKNGVFGTPESTNNNYQYNSSNFNDNTQEFVFCGNCGTKLSKNAKFCPKCGKSN